MKYIFANYPPLYVLSSMFHTKNISISMNDGILSASINPNTRFQHNAWYSGNCQGEFDEIPLSTGNSYDISDLNYEKMMKSVVSDDFGIELSDVIFVSKLPVIYINSNEDIVEKGKDVKVKISIQGNAEFKSQYDGKADIHVRGSSSLEFGNQLSYKIKLNKKTDLFGFGPNRHWVLISNFVDNTLLRNIYATNLAKHLGLVSMDMQLVNVVLNGKVQGVYVLAEHIRVSPNRINIFNWEDYSEELGHTNDNFAWIDSTEIGVDKGYIFELDESFNEDTRFITDYGLKVMVNRPEKAYTSYRMIEYVKNLWNTFHNILKSHNNTYNGKTIQDICDIDSLAKYLLVNIIFGNIDVSTRSRYCYLNENQKLVFGPIWDFDLAANAIPYKDEYTYDGWNIFRNNIQCIWQDVVKIDAVRTKIYQIYNEQCKPYMTSFLQEIDLNSIIYETHGNINDISRNIDVYSPWWKPNSTFTLPGFQQDTQNFKMYMINRVAWLNSQFDSYDAFSTSIMNLTI